MSSVLKRLRENVLLTEHNCDRETLRTAKLLASSGRFRRRFEKNFPKTFAQTPSYKVYLAMGVQ